MRGVFVARSIAAIFAVGVLASALVGPLAAAEQGNFSLQVSPSPLVATIKPGETKQLELKIRNAGISDEELKIEARNFTFDSTTGTIALDDTASPAIAEWLTLPPHFTVKSGEWVTQTITAQLPKESGFSYSFALIISRSNDTTTVHNGQLLKGSVAVFTLLNVDRPGAVKSLTISDLTTSQSVYEFLPATVNIRLKNTGNTIVQPYGNVFIQRPGNNDNPITTLPLNETRAYILPATERSLQTTWSEGFPRYEQTTDASGTQKTALEWNVEQIRKFRFGKYTARVVAVYNDGTRDVPIVGEVTFWVIPWKTLLIILLCITALVLLVRYMGKKRTERAVKKALEEQQKKLQEEEARRAL